MQAQEIYELLQAEFGKDIIEMINEAPSEPFININPKKIVEICLFLRDRDALDFDYLSCLSGMDYKDCIGVVYHLYSVKYKHRIILKVSLDRENPKVPTVERVWRSADWHEREAYDLFGIMFEGHHNLIRILCCYDWEGYPLRKDYKAPEEYHGIPVPY